MRIGPLLKFYQCSLREKCLFKELFTERFIWEPTMVLLWHFNENPLLESLFLKVIGETTRTLKQFHVWFALLWVTQTFRQVKESVTDPNDSIVWNLFHTSGDYRVLLNLSDIVCSPLFCLSLSACGWAGTDVDRLASVITPEIIA